MSFDGKVALVTGATSGIGRETAIQFAKAGAKVVLAGRRQQEGDSVANEINSDGGDALFVQTDVTQEDQVKRLVDQTIERFGRLDIAFNNAGVEHGGPVTEFTEDRLVIEVSRCPYPFTREEICRAHTCMEKSLVASLDPELEHHVGCSIPKGDAYCEHILRKKGRTPASE